MKSFLVNHIKNIGGWTTERKILCFAVDDYGNVRLHNKSSLKTLKEYSQFGDNRFDNLDSLDTREDYEKLFDVLSTVRDKYNQPANFTTYALSANIDFESVLSHQKHYEFEILPETYKKLSLLDKRYDGTLKILKEGIQNKMILPQFHGREHLNVRLFEEYLKIKDPFFMANLSNKSFAAIPALKDRPTVGFTKSFAFWDKHEIDEHKEIIKQGLELFEKIYGYKSKTFTPPAQQLHPTLYRFVEKLGIKSIDKPRKIKRHQGNNQFVLEKNKLGIQNNQNHVTLVRNAMFEPTKSDKIDWVNYTFSQVVAAFKMNKPAIVSSHRVNFCGLINPKNRENGLRLLKQLLKKVVKKYPEVEFLSIEDLVEEILKTSKLKLD